MSTSTTAAALQSKFHATEDSMNARLVERGILNHVLLLALVGKLDVFALGEPGVAKTLSVTTLRDHIVDLSPSGYFWRLLTKFSTPPELFGPPDLEAMDKGVWRHQTDGTLVDAKIALGDEFFNANSAILNALLTYLNEGVFHNDVPIYCDRWMFVGLSNSMPEGEELNALYDRLDLRVVVDRIQSSSGFVQMMKSQALGPIVPTITVEDIEQAQAQVQAVTIGDEIFDALLSLRNDLARAGVEPTDRRFARSLRVARASAWLRGSDVAEIDDLRDLRHSLWTTRDEKATVDTHVLQLASPLDAEAMKLRDQVDKLSEEFDLIFNDSDNKAQRNKKAIDLHTKLDRASDELVVLQGQLPKGRRSEIMDEIFRRLKTMNDTVLMEVFNLDPNAKRKGS